MFRNHEESGIPDFTKEYSKPQAISSKEIETLVLTDNVYKINSSEDVQRATMKHR